MEVEFAQRVAIVTGASGGIGTATADLFEERGARVIRASRSTGFDVSNEADVARLLQEPVDIIINNAGAIEVARLHEMSSDMWDRTFAVNVRGAFLMCKYALPSMIARRSGAIVNVASISGVVGPQKFPGFTAYCASKAALISLTESLAVEVKEHGIRVNCISPGSVDTKMWAEVSNNAPADMTPREIAEAIAFLASDRSRPMNGQNLNVWSV
ncbi:MAG TPA: SDR family NAD(P)-dependent oxidoreductase [Thermoanaerobaculia bacterium]|nr:SDR family NAD(P)-dependent oxidoreductase [Thermoanaerobaculia bacterium]